MAPHATLFFNQHTLIFFFFGNTTYIDFTSMQDILPGISWMAPHYFNLFSI